MDFIDSIYENSEYTEKLKSILSTLENKKLYNIKKVILIGEIYFDSLESVAPKLLYANPNNITYKTTKDGSKITIDDTKYRFTISKDEAKNCICFLRSGYKIPIIQYLAKELSDLGVLVINTPENVLISSDKAAMCKVLDRYNIPQPKYVLVSKSDIGKEDINILTEKLNTIYNKKSDENKYVCKILGGHGGKGVFICKEYNIVSILQCIFAIKPDINIIVQEYCDIKDGDIRVHVITINNKQIIVDSTQRLKGKSDFRTNLSLGNHQINDFKLSDEQINLAKNCAKASGLIWAGIDILPTIQGKNYVIEYNGAPGPASELSTSAEKLKFDNEVFFIKLLKAIDNLM